MNLSKLAELAEKATKGPWVAERDATNSIYRVYAADSLRVCWISDDRFPGKDAAEFIAAFRNHAEALIEVARRSIAFLEWGVPADCDCDGDASIPMCSWHKKANRLTEALAKLEAIK